MTGLSVIIVNYNVKHFLEQCLKSVYKALNGIKAEIIVVDNNSIDGSLNLIKEKLSKIINIPEKRINIKATTNEQVDAIGNLDAIAVYCVCELNFK